MTNYRSLPAIVAAGNGIMSGRGRAAAAAQQRGGDLQVADLAEFRPLAEEGMEFNGKLMPALRRLVVASVEDGKSVALLSRTSAPAPGYKLRWVETCADGLSADAARRVSGSTVHKYKGREADVVILVDASSRSFPMVPGTWALFRIFGDSLSSLTEDERQLLYVAVTRGAKRVICVVDSDRTSGTLSSLFGNAERRFEKINWTSYPMPRRDGKRACFVVISNIAADGSRRGGTHAVKDALKAAGFTYSTGGGPQWSRSMALDVNDDVAQIVTELRRERWAVHSDGIVVQLQSGADERLGTFSVINGVWSEC